MSEETGPSLPFRIGIGVIVIVIGFFIEFYIDEDSLISRTHGFLAMIFVLTSPFVLYSLLSKNKED
tara:strand:+ start:772 stop:969 length:198 start_codon:yes stop_codon:yes gene_type:complete